MVNPNSSNFYPLLSAASDEDKIEILKQLLTLKPPPNEKKTAIYDKWNTFVANSTLPTDGNVKDGKSYKD